METIKNIEIKKGKKIIIFDSGRTVWLDRHLSSHIPLEPGTAVEEPVLEEMILLYQYPSALNDAIALLAVRDRSRLEIRQKLSSKKYEPNVIDMVLYKLETEKLLNDETFSSQWVQTRMKKYGPVRLSQELRKKGINQNTARTAMEQISGDQEIENAVLLAQKKLRTEKKDISKVKLFQHITSFLIRRGFSWETAKKAYEIAMEYDSEKADD